MLFHQLDGCVCFVSEHKIQQLDMLPRAVFGSVFGEKILGSDALKLIGKVAEHANHIIVSAALIDIVMEFIVHLMQNRVVFFFQIRDKTPPVIQEKVGIQIGYGHAQGNRFQNMPHLKNILRRFDGHIGDKCALCGHDDDQLLPFQLGQRFSKPIPTVPNIFMKPDTSLTAPDAPVILPPLYTRQVEHEAELVVVIGKKARFVPEEEALDYVLGYTCGNDVTARDMQSPTNQWSVCKGFDTFAPIGPWIETDLDASHLDIVMRVNGEIRQTTNTKELIFSVPYLISYLSGCMTLNPGDILFTGTTSGVSPVHDGDVMEVDIQSIGVLQNPVKRFEDGK